MRLNKILPLPEGYKTAVSVNMCLGNSYSTHRWGLICIWKDQQVFARCTEYRKKQV